MEKKFRFIDHTGDVGVEVFGDSRRALFRHAAEAFFEIVTDVEKIRARETRHLSLRAEGVEELLVRWLNEFVFLFDTRGLLFSVFEIASLDDDRIEAQVRGEPYDEERHAVKTAVKGATYHQLAVARDGGGWKARVIFDL